MGGGAALFDMDNDGDLDLYLVQSGNLFAPGDKPAGNRLYRNRGDGTFDDVTAGSGADVPGYGMGVAAGDFDNDGNADLYVTNFGGNVLLKGDGHGHFTDVTAKAGVASSGWSTSAAFLDYDADGDLDLFVAHYLNWQRSAEVECYSLTGVPDYCSPKTYDLPSALHALPQQRQRHVHRRTPIAPGCARPSATASAWSPATSNGDGRIDIFVANDGTPNHLWLNRGGGALRERRAGDGLRGRSGRQAEGGHGRARWPTWTATAISICSSSTSTANRTRSIATRRPSFATTPPRSACGRSAGRSRGSAPRSSTSTTTACSTSTRRTAASGGSPTLYSSDPYAEPNLLFRGVAGPRFEEVKPRGGTAHAARRHQPRGGVRRHRQRRRHRHRRRRTATRGRTCSATSSPAAATGRCSGWWTSTVAMRSAPN